MRVGVVVGVGRGGRQIGGKVGRATPRQVLAISQQT